MLNFHFSEKGLGLVSPPHFVYDFSRKIFLMLHSINWPNFIVWFAFTSRDIGKYVYYNCLLTRMWRHKVAKNCLKPESAPLKIGDLKNLAKFTGKYPRQSVFLNFAKFLRTSFLQKTSGWLLLDSKGYIVLQTTNYFWCAFWNRFFCMIWVLKLYYRKFDCGNSNNLFTVF